MYYFKHFDCFKNNLSVLLTLLLTNVWRSSRFIGSLASSSTDSTKSGSSLRDHTDCMFIYGVFFQVTLTTGCSQSAWASLFFIPDLWMSNICTLFKIKKKKHLRRSRAHSSWGEVDRWGGYSSNGTETVSVLEVRKYIMTFSPVSMLNSFVFYIKLVL